MAQKPMSKPELVKEVARLAARVAELEAGGGRTAGAAGESLPLGESEAVLCSLFDAVGDAILVHEPGTGRVLAATPSAPRILGWDRSEVPGLTPEDLASGVPPFNGDNYLHYLELAAEGRPQDFEWLSRTKGGTPLWLEVRMHRTEVTGRLRVVALLRDVNERKAAEQEIQKLSLAVEQSPASVMITDPEGCIEYVNPKFTEVTGFTSAEVLGKNPRILKSDRHTPEFYREMWETISSGRMWTNEMCNRTKSGEEIWELVSIAPVNDFAGRHAYYVAVKEDITLRKRQEERIRHMALHDQLTDLPNRNLCMDRLTQAVARARRTGLKAALIYVDLDEFKPVNDELGHEAGDTVLVEVARRLRSCIRDVDTAARLGGDEFVVVLQDVTNDYDIELVAGRILKAMSEPFAVAGQERVLGASLGVAVAPEHGEKVDEIIRNADLAMYAVKRGARNGVRFYTPDLKPA
jgi:diguanylate cyclase (GGDEF)-like protein/PAS domain S-box-containing protein